MFSWMAGHARRIFDNTYQSSSTWVIAVTCAFAVALGSMFSWMAGHARGIVVDNTYQSSSNLALSVEQFVAHTMESVDLSLRGVLEEVGAGGAKPALQAHQLLAERLRRAPEITALAIVGADGRVLYDSAAHAALGRDAARDGYFKAARESAMLQFSVEDTPRAHERPRVFASRRFNRPDGRFAGVIVATLNIDYLQQFLSTLHVGDHGIIALDATDGTMLVRQPYVEGAIGKNYRTSPLFREWLPWASSGVFSVPYESDHRVRIIGYQRAEKVPLVVEVALDKDEALTDWRHTTLFQGVVALIILGLAVVTAYLLNRQLKARLLAHEQLRKTVRELEAARFAAEESSRVKSQFLANMSHELRTPLNAVIGYSEILLEDAKAHPEQEADLKRIRTAGENLLALVNDVLDVSAIEVGRLELEEAEVDLAQLIEDCRCAVERRVAEARLELTIELPAQPPILRGDELRLRQVVLNLLSNAAKFTPAGGRIALSARPNAAGGLEISVADTGIGMKPEEIPRALEPFQQLDDGLNRRYEGTGLGLALARHLAELHGGTLRIESAPNQGTTVTFTLPPERVIAKTVPAIAEIAAK